MIIDPKTQVPVYVGRFSPLHNGHCEIIDEVISIWDCLLIAVCVPTIENKEMFGKTPFFSTQRMLFIYKYIYSENFIKRFGWKTDYIWVEKINDVGNAPLWMNILEEKTKVFPDREPVYVIGRPKDSEFYTIPRDDGTKRLTYKTKANSLLSATMVREKLSKGEDISKLVNPVVYQDIIDAWSKI